MKNQDRSIVLDNPWPLFFEFLLLSAFLALLGKLFPGKLVSLIADLSVAFFRALPDIVAGAVIGGLVVASGFLLLGAYVAVVEVGERRRALLPEYRRAVPFLAPKSLRWVGYLLPCNEGMAWLIEVTSCLAETSDKKIRRRYLRSYWHGVPQLIWTSWAEHLGASRRRELL